MNLCLCVIILLVIIILSENVYSEGLGIDEIYAHTDHHMMADDIFISNESDVIPQGIKSVESSLQAVSPKAMKRQLVATSVLTNNMNYHGRPLTPLGSTDCSQTVDFNFQSDAAASVSGNFTMTVMRTGISPVVSQGTWSKSAVNNSRPNDVPVQLTIVKGPDLGRVFSGYITNSNAGTDYSIVIFAPGYSVPAAWQYITTVDPLGSNYFQMAFSLIDASVKNYGSCALDTSKFLINKQYNSRPLTASGATDCSTTADFNFNVNTADLTYTSGNFTMTVTRTGNSPVTSQGTWKSSAVNSSRPNDLPFQLTVNSGPDVGVVFSAYISRTTAGKYNLVIFTPGYSAPAGWQYQTIINAAGSSYTQLAFSLTEFSVNYGSCAIDTSKFSGNYFLRQVLRGGAANGAQGRNCNSAGTVTVASTGAGSISFNSVVNQTISTGTRTVTTYSAINMYAVGTAPARMDIHRTSVSITWENGTVQTLTPGSYPADTKGIFRSVSDGSDLVFNAQGDIPYPTTFDTIPNTTNTDWKQLFLELRGSQTYCCAKDTSGKTPQSCIAGCQSVDQNAACTASSFDSCFSSGSFDSTNSSCSRFSSCFLKTSYAQCKTINDCMANPAASPSSPANCKYALMRFCMINTNYQSDSGCKSTVDGLNASSLSWVTANQNTHFPDSISAVLNLQAFNLFVQSSNEVVAYYTFQTSSGPVKVTVPKQNVQVSTSVGSSIADITVKLAVPSSSEISNATSSQRVLTIGYDADLNNLLASPERQATIEFYFEKATISYISPLYSTPGDSLSLHVEYYRQFDPSKDKVLFGSQSCQNPNVTSFDPFSYKQIITCTIPTTISSGSYNVTVFSLTFASSVQILSTAASVDTSIIYLPNTKIKVTVANTPSSVNVANLTYKFSDALNNLISLACNSTLSGSMLTSECYTPANFNPKTTFLAAVKLFNSSSLLASFQLTFYIHIPKVTIVSNTTGSIVGGDLLSVVISDVPSWTGTFPGAITWDGIQLNIPTNANYCQSLPNLSTATTCILFDTVSQAPSVVLKMYVPKKTVGGNVLYSVSFIQSSVYDTKTVNGTFNYFNPNMGRISLISPSSAFSGQTVAIYLADLSLLNNSDIASYTTVKFNNVAATGVVVTLFSVTAPKLQVTVPSQSLSDYSGNVDVGVVISEPGKASVSMTSQFTYVVRPPPSVINVSPDSVNIQVNTGVTISVANFAPYFINGSMLKKITFSPDAASSSFDCANFSVVIDGNVWNFSCLIPANSISSTATTSLLMTVYLQFGSDPAQLSSSTISVTKFTFRQNLVVSQILSWGPSQASPGTKLYFYMLNFPISPTSVKFSGTSTTVVSFEAMYDNKTNFGVTVPELGLTTTTSIPIIIVSASCQSNPSTCLTVNFDYMPSLASLPTSLSLYNSSAANIPLQTALSTTTKFVLRNYKFTIPTGKSLSDVLIVTYVKSSTSITVGITVDSVTPVVPDVGGNVLVFNAKILSTNTSLTSGSYTVKLNDSTGLNTTSVVLNITAGPNIYPNNVGSSFYDDNNISVSFVVSNAPSNNIQISYNGSNFVDTASASIVLDSFNKLSITNLKLPPQNVGTMTYSLTFAGTSTSTTFTFEYRNTPVAEVVYSASYASNSSVCSNSGPCLQALIFNFPTAIPTSSLQFKYSNNESGSQIFPLSVSNNVRFQVLQLTLTRPSMFNGNLTLTVTYGTTTLTTLSMSFPSVSINAPTYSGVVPSNGMVNSGGKFSAIITNFISSSSPSVSDYSCSLVSSSQTTSTGTVTSIFVNNNLVTITCALPGGSNGSYYVLLKLNSGNVSVSIPVLYYDAPSVTPVIQSVTPSSVTLTAPRSAFNINLNVLNLYPMIASSDVKITLGALSGTITSFLSVFTGNGSTNTILTVQFNPADSFTGSTATLTVLSLQRTDLTATAAIPMIDNLLIQSIGAYPLAGLQTVSTTVTANFLSNISIVASDIIVSIASGQINVDSVSYNNTYLSISFKMPAGQTAGITPVTITFYKGKSNMQTKTITFTYKAGSIGNATTITLDNSSAIEAIPQTVNVIVSGNFDDLPFGVTQDQITVLVDNQPTTSTGEAFFANSVNGTTYFNFKYHSFLRLKDVGAHKVRIFLSTRSNNYAEFEFNVNPAPNSIIVYPSQAKSFVTVSIGIISGFYSVNLANAKVTIAASQIIPTVVTSSGTRTLRFVVPVVSTTSGLQTLTLTIEGRTATFPFYFIAPHDPSIVGISPSTGVIYYGGTIVSVFLKNLLTTDFPFTGSVQVNFGNGNITTLSSTTGVTAIRGYCIDNINCDGTITFTMPPNEYLLNPATISVIIRGLNLIAPAFNFYLAPNPKIVMVSTSPLNPTGNDLLAIRIYELPWSDSVRLGAGSSSYSAARANALSTIKSLLRVTINNIAVTVQSVQVSGFFTAYPYSYSNSFITAQILTPQLTSGTYELSAYVYGLNNYVANGSVTYYNNTVLTFQSGSLSGTASSFLYWTFSGLGIITDASIFSIQWNSTSTNPISGKVDSITSSTAVSTRLGLMVPSTVPSGNIVVLIANLSTSKSTTVIFNVIPQMRVDTTLTTQIANACGGDFMKVTILFFPIVTVASDISVIVTGSKTETSIIAVTPTLLSSTSASTSFTFLSPSTGSSSNSPTATVTVTFTKDSSKSVSYSLSYYSVLASASISPYQFKASTGGSATISLKYVGTAVDNLASNVSFSVGDVSSNVTAYSAVTNTISVTIPPLSSAQNSLVANATVSVISNQSCLSSSTSLTVTYYDDTLPILQYSTMADFIASSTGTLAFDIVYTNFSSFSAVSGFVLLLDSVSDTSGAISNLSVSVIRTGTISFKAQISKNLSPATHSILVLSSDKSKLFGSVSFKTLDSNTVLLTYFSPASYAIRNFLSQTIIMEFDNLNASTSTPPTITFADMTIISTSITVTNSVIGTSQISRLSFPSPITSLNGQSSITVSFNSKSFTSTINLLDVCPLDTYCATLPGGVVANWTRFYSDPPLTCGNAAMQTYCASPVKPVVLANSFSKIIEFTTATYVVKITKMPVTDATKYVVRIADFSSQSVVDNANNKNYSSFVTLPSTVITKVADFANGVYLYINYTATSSAATLVRVMAIAALQVTSSPTTFAETYPAIFQFTLLKGVSGSPVFDSATFNPQILTSGELTLGNFFITNWATINGLSYLDISCTLNGNTSATVASIVQRGHPEYRAKVVISIPGIVSTDTTIPITCQATKGTTTQTASGTWKFQSELPPVIMSIYPTNVIAGANQTLALTAFGMKLASSASSVTLKMAITGSTDILISSSDIISVVSISNLTTIKFKVGFISVPGTYNISLKRADKTVFGTLVGGLRISPVGPLVTAMSVLSMAFNATSRTIQISVNYVGATSEQVLLNDANGVSATRILFSSTSSTYSVTLPSINQSGVVQISISRNNSAVDRALIPFVFLTPSPIVSVPGASSNGGASVTLTIYEYAGPLANITDASVQLLGQSSSTPISIALTGVSAISNSPKINSATFTVPAGLLVGNYNISIRSSDNQFSSGQALFSIYAAATILSQSNSSGTTLSQNPEWVLSLGNVPSTLDKSYVLVTLDNSAIPFALSSSGTTRTMTISPPISSTAKSSTLYITVSSTAPGYQSNQSLKDFNIISSYTWTEAPAQFVSSPASVPLTGNTNESFSIFGFGVIVSDSSSVSISITCSSGTTTFYWNVQLNSVVVNATNSSLSSFVAISPVMPTSVNIGDSVLCNVVNLNPAGTQNTASFTYMYYDTSVVYVMGTITAGSGSVQNSSSFTVTSGWPITNNVVCSSLSTTVSFVSVSASPINTTGKVFVSFVLSTYTGTYSMTDSSGIPTQVVGLSCYPVSVPGKVVSFDFTLYVPLSVSSSTFTSDYLNIDIVFNQATDRVPASPANCSTYISTPITGGLCSFIDSKTLCIKLDSTATIVPNSSLDLLSSIGDAKFKIGYAGGSISVAGAGSGASILGNIYMPQVVGPCDSNASVNLQISGATGGRTPTFSWTISSPSGTVSSDLLSSINSQTTPTFSLDLTLLAFTTNYIITATVLDFLGQTFSFSAGITRSNSSAPSIIFPPTTTVFPCKTCKVIVAGTASFSSCDSSKPSLSLSIVKSNSTAGSFITTAGGNIVIDGSTLVGGTTLNFTANIFETNTPSNSSTSQFSVIVRLPDIVAAISNGNSLKVSNLSTLTLDGSSSAERFTDSKDGLKYSWSCTNAGDSRLGCPNVGTVINNQTYTFMDNSSTERVPSGVYDVVLVVTSNKQVTDSSGNTATIARSSKATITVTVVAIALPSVRIITPSFSTAMRASSPLQLTAVITGSSGWTNQQYQWSLQSPTVNAQTIDKIISTPTSTALIIGFNGNSFVPGISAVIVFTFTGTDPISSTTQTTSATVNIPVNAPPVAGGVTISPTSGIALTTKFTITADSNWTSNQSSVSSLKYSYAISTNGVTFKQLASNTINTLYGFLLEQGGTISGVPNTVKVVVTATDASGDQVSATTTVTVTAIPSGEETSSLNACITNVTDSNTQFNSDNSSAVLAACAGGANSVSTSTRRRLLATDAEMATIRTNLISLGCSSWNNLQSTSSVITQAFTTMTTLLSGSQAQYTIATLVSAITCLETVVKGAPSETSFDAAAGNTFYVTLNLWNTLFIGAISSSTTPTSTQLQTASDAYTYLRAQIEILVLQEIPLGSVATKLASGTSLVTLASKVSVSSFNELGAIGGSTGNPCGSFTIDGVANELLATSQLTSAIAMYGYTVRNSVWTPLVPLSTQNKIISTGTYSIEVADGGSKSQISVKNLVSSSVKMVLCSKGVYSTTSPVCAWWDSSSGSYSNEGCSVLSRTSNSSVTQVSCQCNRLGQFVVQDYPYCVAGSGTLTLVNNINPNMIVLSEMIAGGVKLVVTLSCYTFNALTTDFVNAFNSALKGSGSDVNGWNLYVIPALSLGQYSLDSTKSILTITLPALSSFSINQWENITLTIPKALMSFSGGNVSDLNTLTTIRIPDDSGKTSFIQTSLDFKTTFATASADSSYMSNIVSDISNALQIAKSRVLGISFSASKTNIANTTFTFQLFATTDARVLSLLSNLQQQIVNTSSNIYKFVNSKTVDAIVTPTQLIGIACLLNNAASLSSSYIRTSAVLLSIILSGDLFVGFDSTLYFNSLKSGITGSSASATGFNTVIKPLLQASNIVLNSQKTMITVTIPMTVAYSVNVDEVLTLSIPQALLQSNKSIAAGSVVIIRDAVATLSDTLGLSAESIISGTGSIVINVSGATMVNAMTSTIKNNIVSNFSGNVNGESGGWNAQVSPILANSPNIYFIINPATFQQITILIPAVQNYNTNFNESVSITLPVSLFADYAQPIVVSSKKPVKGNVVSATNPPKASFQIKMGRDVSACTGANAATFNTSIINALSSASNIDSSRFNVDSCTAGSSIANVSVTGTTASNANVAAAAVTQNLSAVNNILGDVVTTYASPPCGSVNGSVCSNNGTCNIGACVCSTGYSGTLCTVQQSGASALITSFILSLITISISVILIY